MIIFEPEPGKLCRDISHEEFVEMQNCWVKYLMFESSRNIEGLLSTLTEDCVYELPQFNKRFLGHAGAAEFYQALFLAYPDIKFYPTSLFINFNYGLEYGVLEIVMAKGTQRGEWLGISPLPVEKKFPVNFRLGIFLPWDNDKKKFRGAIIFAVM